jgi:hypothetical protein
MKFYETHFEDYCKSFEKFDVSLAQKAADTLPDILAHENDVIVYGSSGSGKYSYVLSMLKPYSPSQLKYDKKIKATTDKQSYTYRISDIHYEIDMSLLGCNSKIIWHEIYSQIVDIISIKPEKMGFIVCKNFHAIHNELLDIFYSYMQQHCYGYEGKSREVKIHFILVTEHVSFLPNNILNRCTIVRIPRPSVEDMIAFSNINKSKPGTESIMKTVASEDVMNIKEIYSFALIKSPEELPTDHFNKVCDVIIQEMMLMVYPQDLSQNDATVGTAVPANTGNKGVVSHPEVTQMTKFRDCLYDILIYNLDGIECIWYIFQYFIRNRIIISPKKMIHLMNKLTKIFKQYGNNYRSIFHIENAIFSMMEAFEVTA